MPISPELIPIITQAKKQYPELASLPDETIAQMILQAMQDQRSLPTDKRNPAKMSVTELIEKGEQLMNAGRWQEAERYFFQALEHATQEKDAKKLSVALTNLGRLCLQRGDFPQAIRLYQQALVLAEQVGDRHLMAVIYDQIGSTYRMQGDYPYAIEYYKKSIDNSEKNGDEHTLSIGYGNLVHLGINKYLVKRSRLYLDKSI